MFPTAAIVFALAAIQWKKWKSVELKIDRKYLFTAIIEDPFHEYKNKKLFVF
jgi:hypothetical protein